MLQEEVVGMVVSGGALRLSSFGDQQEGGGDQDYPQQKGVHKEEAEQDDGR